MIVIFVYQLNIFKLFVEVNLAILFLYIQFLDNQQEEEVDEDLDYRALESGYVSWNSVFSINIFIFHIGACYYAGIFRC